MVINQNTWFFLKNKESLTIYKQQFSWEKKFSACHLKIISVVSLLRFEASRDIGRVRVT